MNSFNFNSTDFSDFNVVVVKGDRPFFPEIETQSTPLGLGDGVVFSTNRYKQQEIQLDCVIRGTSYSDLLAKKDSVSAALHNREESKLILETVPDRFYYAKLNSVSKFKFVSPKTGSFTASFIMGDPFTFSLSEYSTSATLSLNGQPITSTVAGNAETYPIIECLCNSTISSFGVANETLDKRLAWVASPTNLVSGDKVIIECSPFIRNLNGVEPQGGQCLKIKKAAESQAFIRNAGISGYFPLLTPTANTLTFWGLRGTATIKWYNRFI